jgi:PKHD-type hydroxylase
MAFQSYWFQTNIPKEIITVIENDLKQFDSLKGESELTGGRKDHDRRNSENVWIPTTHWVGGFVWHYVQKANRENFLYNLTAIDNESLQYTIYNKGQFYEWHTDSSISSHHSPASFDETLQPPAEYIRKLSIVFQLTDDTQYEGGDLEIQSDEGEIYKAPRTQGSVIIFDSRARHRVTPVTDGIRKSLVGWVMGPRWK